MTKQHSKGVHFQPRGFRKEIARRALDRDARTNKYHSKEAAKYNDKNSVNYRGGVGNISPLTAILLSTALAFAAGSGFVAQDASAQEMPVPYVADLCDPNNKYVQGALYNVDLERMWYDDPSSISRNELPDGGFYIGQRCEGLNQYGEMDHHHDVALFFYPWKVKNYEQADKNLPTKSNDIPDGAKALTQFTGEVENPYAEGVKEFYFDVEKVNGLPAEEQFNYLIPLVGAATAVGVSLALWRARQKRKKQNAEEVIEVEPLKDYMW